MYILCDDDYPSVTELPSIPQGDGSSITSLCCIESRFTYSGELCIIAACWNESIYAITPTQVIDLNIKVFLILLYLYISNVSVGVFRKWL